MNNQWFSQKARRPANFPLRLQFLQPSRVLLDFQQALSGRPPLAHSWIGAMATGLRPWGPSMGAANHAGHYSKQSAGLLLSSVSRWDQETVFGDDWRCKHVQTMARQWKHMAESSSQPKLRQTLASAFFQLKSSCCWHRVASGSERHAQLLFISVYCDLMDPVFSETCPSFQGTLQMQTRCCQWPVRVWLQDLWPCGDSASLSSFPREWDVTESHDAAIDKEKIRKVSPLSMPTCGKLRFNACIQATNLIALAMSKSSSYRIAGKEEFRSIVYNQMHLQCVN